MTDERRDTQSGAEPYFAAIAEGLEAEAAHYRALAAAQTPGAPQDRRTPSGTAEALMADALTWSTTEPWMAGWWWVRDAFRNRPPEVVEVTEGPDGDFWTDDGAVAVDEMAAGTEWAGPIPHPTAAPSGTEREPEWLRDKMRRERAAMQNHMAQLLRILGLGDHARPESPAAVMEHEIIPAVRGLFASPDDPKAAYMNARTCICGADASAHRCPDDPKQGAFAAPGPATAKPHAPRRGGFDPDWQAMRERYFDLAPSGMERAPSTLDEHRAARRALTETEGEE